MTFHERIVRAWMAASDFATARSVVESNGGFKELSEKWAQRSIRCELQGLLIAEMDDPAIKSSEDLAAQAQVV